MTTPASSAIRYELVFALVRPTGCPGEEVVSALRAELSRVAYVVAGVVKMSALLQGLRGLNDGVDITSTDLKEDDRIEQHMNAGDTLRDQLEDCGALAQLAACDIAGRRPRETASNAWIIDSLKHKDEVAFLRKLYGQQLVIIAVYADEDRRVSSLTAKIAQSWKTRVGAEDRAKALIERDLAGSDTKPNGQDVRDTFPLADYFLTLGRDMREQVGRMIETLFGKPNRSPTRDEYAMCVARDAALRSADLSRQVGAVIVDEDGEVVVAGCNEVPKTGGGVYWEGDVGDKRDHTLGYDPNAATSRDMLVELFARLSAAGWLKDPFAQEGPVDLAERAKRDRVLKRTRAASLVEFGRIVHAEMNALLRAAAGGYRIRGLRMVCTTFPCHVCARHLLGAGLAEVVYIEPYPKSLAAQQYPDSIVVGERSATGALRFRPFTGWAPIRYARVFKFRDRKDSDGYLDKWDPLQSFPKISGFPDAHKYVESDLISKTERVLLENKITRIPIDPTTCK